MIKTTVWMIIVINGSYLPSGQFKSYEECRQSAIIQFKDMADRYGPAAIPPNWKCMESVLIEDKRTIEEREIK